jgi:RNA 2',3'-cyclic 3'-phosphodiesterase
MRAFIAIDLPESVREKLAEIESELRPATSAARWVAPESIHLTLKFIGEISEARLRDIDQALEGLTWRPFQVSVRGVGFFPGTRSPRVLWAGLTASTMNDLAKEIDVRMERFGFEKEKRAFRPHLTLARAKQTRLEGALVESAKRFENVDCGSFTVERCFLFRSTLKTGGAVYTKLKEYILDK